MSDTAVNVLCIGSVMWDIIGRSGVHMERGSDVAGRISRLPGGVAMNIAMALRRLGVGATLLSAVGDDEAGRALLDACASRGIVADHIYRASDRPTDRYMAVEGANGLIAAIADAHTLEAVGARILAPLADGRLGSADRPHAGIAVVDGNLPVEVLAEIATGPLLAAADLRIAPASPGKAQRLSVFLDRADAARSVTLYLNREEAALLCHHDFASAAEAARALVARGARRVLVTDGPRAAADADAGALLERTPPQVMVTRVTGAGDVFMAAHIAAEARGLGREQAFAHAQRVAADYVSGEAEL